VTNCLAVGGGTESCCTSLEVPGGKYDRTYTNNGAGPTDEADPATVRGFRLDTYLVTVGRFRQYVNYLTGGSGSLPANGSGKHTHLNDQNGLATSGGTPAYETGWDTADLDQNLTTVSGGWNDADNWNASLSSAGQPSSTWTSTAGTDENLPINSVNWYEAYAFCIWDGGFLPSRAEWEYAAAGGSQQREYPWGSTTPGNAYAIFGDDYDGNPTRIAPVGFASSGVALWRQLDMAGDLWEWNLDSTGYFDPCTDCAYLPTGASVPMVGGGSFNIPSSYMPASFVHDNPPMTRIIDVGFRCARTP
jgi:formylglycine-generating enzyme required for sulfatase activity